MKAELFSPLCAIAAATCWAFGSLLAARVSTHIGAFSFVRWRMFFAKILLLLWVVVDGSWQSLALEHLGLLTLSAFIGVVLGDTALFASMNRLGPRRTGVIFSTHALFSVVLAWFFLDERLWGWALIGSLLLVTGVMIAVLWGRNRHEEHPWEHTQGHLTIGIVLGIIAAIGQAGAMLIVKPLMNHAIDPVAGSAVRISAGFLIHAGFWLIRMPQARIKHPLTLQLVGLTFINAAISLALGMTLILVALQHGPANLVGIFSSISPIVLLPMLWVVYKRRPAFGAWIGAFLTITGSTLILLN